MPVVTATTPWAGLRPVANAFGDGSSMTKNRGIGMPARAASSAVIAWRPGPSSRESGRAPFILSTSRSEKK
jgi:hypothetical protein